MSWFKNVFSSQQETKVVYEKSKSESENKEDKKEGEEETETVSELKIDEGQESSGSCSQNSWWSSWSGLSTPFKRELSEFHNQLLLHQKTYQHKLALIKMIT